MTKKDIADFVRPVDGWLFDGEARLLYELARNANPEGVIVEIGSWKGKSTICLAKGSADGPRLKIYAIDPHIGSEEHRSSGTVWTFDQFKANIQKAGIEDLVVPLVKMSTDAARDFDLPISLVFIDGAHDFDSVKADFEVWFPKVIDGGIVAFHDTTGWEGPRRLVRKVLFRNPKVCRTRFAWSIAYAQKTSRAGTGQRILSLLLLPVKVLHDFVLNIATKPGIKRFISAVLGRRGRG